MSDNRGTPVAPRRPPPGLDAAEKFKQQKRLARRRIWAIVIGAIIALPVLLASAVSNHAGVGFVYLVIWGALAWYVGRSKPAGS